VGKIALTILGLGEIQLLEEGKKLKDVFREDVGNLGHSTRVSKFGERWVRRGESVIDTQNSVALECER
jgi:hypothetical protein